MVTLHASRDRVSSEEIVLARRAQAGDAGARRRMIEMNQALVFSVARKFHRAAMELEDLAQEGVLGLARAIDLFDPARGLRSAPTPYTGSARRSRGRSISRAD